MYIDVSIETWHKNTGTHLFYLYTTGNHGADRFEIDAFRVFKELINNENGLWKDKQFKSIDNSWGAVKVTKSDIIDFIEKVNKEIRGDSADNMEKVVVLDDDKYYALVGCES